ncbi:MAG: biliverdin-producing heme oxygenase [Bdellovibrionales bacterium]|nr:biliverdin-producing heme oxygenase [Bdellovibrionales bacterium]
MIQSLRIPPKTKLSVSTTSGRYKRLLLTSSLKRDTLSAHAEIENGSLINQILAGKREPARRSLVTSGKISQQEFERRTKQFKKVYIAALQAQYGFELALENALDKSLLGKKVRAALALPDPDTYASQFIEVDMQVLGQAPLFTKMELPEYRTIPEAIGGLYVRIGSRMGGLIIAKNVRQILGIDATSGAQFYGLYGKDTNLVFAEFLKGADSYTQDPSDIHTAVSFANKTFRTVGLWQQRVYTQEIPEIVQAHRPSKLVQTGKMIGRWFLQDV